MIPPHRLPRVVMLLFVLGCAGPLLAVRSATNDAIRAVLELEDGSRVVGMPSATTLKIQGSFAEMEIPLRSIRRVQFKADRKTLNLDLVNGDKVSGVRRADSLEMSTLVGDIQIPLEQARAMRILGGRGHAGAEGLVLWNRLGSEAEIEASEVGPAGVCTGGEFVEGKFGGAIKVGPSRDGVASFPKEVIRPSAGCIELWVKLVGVAGAVASGESFNFVLLSDGNQDFAIHMNTNDGTGNGGLCGWAGRFGSAGTGGFGRWPYDAILGAGQAAGWHHYALVWDEKGLPGVGDEKHHIAVYLDGKLNSRRWGPDHGAAAPLTGGSLSIMVNQNLKQGSVVLDNLKVWDHAKTDFEDRLEE